MSSEVASAVKTPSNPSRRAITRVKDPLAIPTVCPCCGGAVVIKHHHDIYNGRSYGDWPWVYGCTDCDARVGLHPFTNLPLGTLADEPLRKARELHKAPFELIWRDGHLSRGAAYRWLAEQLGLKRDRCHFGLFDLELCVRAGQACQAYLASKG